MTGGAIARRYGRALFELAAAEKKVEEIGGELARLLQAYREVEALPGALSDPTVPRSRRKELATRLAESELRLSGVLRNFLHVLIENGRVREIPDIVQRYREMADEAAGRAHVIVRSASPLADQDRARLEAGLSEVTGKRVTVEVRQDPTLIGGLVAQVGSLVFDGSVRAQLEALGQDLRRGLDV
jgi:F-type H+-transporting ATPase subunit delta